MGGLSNLTFGSFSSFIVKCSMSLDDSSINYDSLLGDEVNIYQGQISATRWTRQVLGLDLTFSNLSVEENLLPLNFEY